MEPKDRKAVLLASQTYNGIDFVEIADCQQTTLRVHFFNDVSVKGTLLTTPTITGGERIPTVTVNPIHDSDWSTDDLHQVLTLTVPAPGDFSNYLLTISSPVLDSFYTTSVFSFKACCPSDLDCQPPAIQCPPVTADVPPIDYLSKDFLGFRQALLDFSALRYPLWKERSEADFGMMFLEALCSLADDLSYQQDRTIAECGLETATQRRSVQRLARLVDYEPQPALCANVLLQFDVNDGTTALPYGLQVSARAPDGTPIAFETGGSLYSRYVDSNANRLPAPSTDPVSAAWNRGKIQPYWFDDSQKCLRSGATQMYVLGQGFKFQPGQALLIETIVTSADPPLRQIVHLTGSSEICDPLFTQPYDPSAFDTVPFLICPLSEPTAEAPTAVTLIQWGTNEALAQDRDLTQTILAGNLISATHGYTVQSSGVSAPFSTQSSESFAIPSASGNPAGIPPAIVRTGTNDTPSMPSFQYLYTLSQRPLAWLSAATAGDPAVPEIILTGTPPPPGQTVIWPFVTDLLDAAPYDNAFTIDPALYNPVATLSNSTTSATPTTPFHVMDYDGDGGDTIRFGDSNFGQVPLDGTRYDVIYRVGGGGIGNVAPDSITQLGANAAGVQSVTNPLPASGGQDAETVQQIQQNAPQAFRAIQYRAVRPEDYEAAARTLPWVKQAGTVFRWTGSWLTVFTTADPLQTEQMDIGQQTGLINLLNRYRMAGYESYVPQPQYVSLDLVVEVCATPDAYQGNVEAGILSALSSSGGFFDHDNFSFGQALQRSSLEAAVQAVNGVAGVTCVLCRVRELANALSEMPATIVVGYDQIVRCDNDPSSPDRGSLKVVVQGGK